MPSNRSTTAIIAALIAATCSTSDFFVGAARASDRSSLWHVVQGCVALKQTTGITFPCTDVELPSTGNNGTVVLKSPRYPTEFLVTPATHVEGVESAELSQPVAAHLWQDAWDSRSLVEDKLGRTLPASGVGLVVNSAGSRTQDQFHIHIDCVAASVTKALAEFVRDGRSDWQELDQPLAGNRYMARLLTGADLAADNPTALVAAALPQGKSLRKASIAVVGVGEGHQSDGFVVLASFTDKAAEPLLDHHCR